MDPSHLNGGLKRGLTVRLALQMENLAFEFLHYTGLLCFLSLGQVKVTLTTGPLISSYLNFILGSGNKFPTFMGT